MVVGGGSLGVEVAGDIAEDFPQVKVTLVQSADRLLPEFPAKLGIAAATRLQAKGATVRTMLQGPKTLLHGRALGCTRILKSHPARNATGIPQYLSPQSAYKACVHCCHATSCSFMPLQPKAMSNRCR